MKAVTAYSICQTALSRRFGNPSVHFFLPLTHFHQRVNTVQFSSVKVAPSYESSHPLRCLT